VSHFSTRQIAANVLSNWGGVAVAMLLSFLATPFVVTRLGDSAYGLWVLSASVAGYLGLLDLGVRGAISRYIAMFAARHEDAAASRIATAGIRIFTITAVIAVGVSFILSLGTADWFSIPIAYRDAARIVLVLTGFNVGISLLAGAYAGIVVARHRLDLANLVDVVIGVSRTLATVLVLLAGYGIVAMSATHAVLSVVRTAWLAWLSRRLYPTLQVSFRGIDLEQVRLILSFSIFSFLIHISGRLIYYTDALVIASFLPVSALTFFALGGSLVEYARMLVSSVSVSASPVASTLDGIGDYDRVRTLLTQSARLTTMILLPIAITFIIRGSAFIGLWIGPAYAAQSGGVLAILALPLLFHGGAHGTGGLMLAVGRHKPMVPAMLTEALVNLALSIALVQAIGVQGVAWGTALPSLVSSVLFWPWYIRRAVGISIGTYLATIWLRPWIAIAPFALGTYVVERVWPAATLATFFIQVGSCCLLALAGYWWVCFSQPERTSLVSAARRLLRP
jgi:O-antigen/teichoic acid export membrane protein